MKTIELDIVFISYDEPNADINYADLCSKAPWAKRVHGVKGSDAAHKAAAEIAETEWFITIDGDNVVYPEFFDLEIDTNNPIIQVYGWCGNNVINGLKYGNGGVKIWKRGFVFNMKTHEEATSDRAQVDFCWENGYKNFPTVYSDTVINNTPFQAWRAGFREGVKMTLLNGVKVPPQEITKQIWWHNIHRLRMWSTVGAHIENGKYAILGSRLGTWMTNCTDWNYIDVRDFEVLNTIYEENTNHDTIDDDIEELGERIKIQSGLDWPNFNASQSKNIIDLYNETINLTKTYYN